MKALIAVTCCAVLAAVGFQFLTMAKANNAINHDSECAQLRHEYRAAEAMYWRVIDGTIYRKQQDQITAEMLRKKCY